MEKDTEASHEGRIYSNYTKALAHETRLWCTHKHGAHWNMIEGKGHGGGLWHHLHSCARPLVMGHNHHNSVRKCYLCSIITLLMGHTQTIAT